MVSLSQNWISAINRITQTQRQQNAIIITLVLPKRLSGRPPLHRIHHSQDSLFFDLHVNRRGWQTLVQLQVTQRRRRSRLSKVDERPCPRTTWTQKIKSSFWQLPSERQEICCRVKLQHLEIKSSPFVIASYHNDAISGHFAFRAGLDHTLINPNGSPGHWPAISALAVTSQRAAVSSLWKSRASNCSGWTRCWLEILKLNSWGLDGFC